jgi:hypothetical protein
MALAVQAAMPIAQKKNYSEPLESPFSLKYLGPVEAASARQSAVDRRRVGIHVALGECGYEDV